MPKKIFNAGVKAPDIPKVRYMRRKPPGEGSAFKDVTRDVSSVELELVNGTGGPCALVRRASGGEEVWRTLHQSVEEARTQALYEYDVKEQDWIAPAEGESGPVT